jgi:hypothetical protein
MAKFDVVLTRTMTYTLSLQVSAEDDESAHQTAEALLRGYPETSGPHCIAFKPPSDDNEKQD